jgi:hypothetical protein
MPSWLYASITVMTPMQGLFLASLGVVGLAMSMSVKRKHVQAVGLVAFIFGGYGCANMLAGLLPIAVG